MNEQALRFRLGLFVLASLILLAVLITLFGGFPSYFKSTDSYIVTFDNAQGVTPGTPVKRSGVRVGEVRTVRLDNATGKVQVEINVEVGYVVRRGDKPTIVQGLFGGDTSISFLPPREDEPQDLAVVTPGSQLVGFSQLDATVLFQKAGEVIPPTQEAMIEMKKFFQKMDKMTPLLEETLKEFREVAKATRELVPEVKEVFKLTRETIPEFREVAKSMRETIPEFRDMAKAAKEAIPEFKEVAKATREMIPEIRKTNAELQELIKTTRNTIPEVQKELKKVTDEFQVTTRTWGKVGERVDILLQTNDDKITKSLDRLQDALKRFGEVFSDENQKYLRDTLKNVKTGSDHLEGIAKGTEDLIKESRVTLKSVAGSLDKINDIVGDLHKMTKPLAERGESVFKNLDETTANLNKMLGDVRQILGMVTRSDGTVQKLFTDPALFNNLNDTLISLNRTMPRIDRILRDVEIFADKIARHPEALGVGGAIRPGSGIKEAPNTPLRIHP